MGRACGRGKLATRSASVKGGAILPSCHLESTWSSIYKYSQAKKNLRYFQSFCSPSFAVLMGQSWKDGTIPAPYKKPLSSWKVECTSSFFLQKINTLRCCAHCVPILSVVSDVKEGITSEIQANTISLGSTLKELTQLIIYTYIHLCTHFPSRARFLLDPVSNFEFAAYSGIYSYPHSSTLHSSDQDQRNL